jgi:hypothetical protein
MITFPEASGPDFFVLHVSGEVTDADYRHVLMPALDQAVETGDPAAHSEFFR